MADFNGIRHPAGADAKALVPYEQNKLIILFLEPASTIALLCRVRNHVVFLLGNYHSGGFSRKNMMLLTSLTTMSPSYSNIVTAYSLSSSIVVKPTSIP
jgi:hypothetical protein